VIRTLRHDDVPAVVDACDWLFAPPSTKPGLWDASIAAERLHETAGKT
jgi:hypothetical protein